MLPFISRRAFLASAAAPLIGGCGKTPSNIESEPSAEAAVVFTDGVAPKTIEVLIHEPNRLRAREEKDRTPGADGEFATFHYDKKWDKPFLHALRTPSGIDVTRGFPVAPRGGESDDHPWHRGLWWGHGDINGVDFWRELGPDKTGRLVVQGEPTRSSETATLSVRLGLQPPSGDLIGTVLQSWTFSVGEDHNIVDAEIRIKASEAVPLKMGDTEDGGFGFRFDDAFRQDRGATLLNSRGQVGTGNIWGKRAAWVDYSTEIDGRKVGVAMFDHPSNPKYPTYWHARGYGLCAVNPFGEHDFHGDPSRDGSLTVAEGDELVFRYRVVIHDGDADDADVVRLYSSWADPA